MLMRFDPFRELDRMTESVWPQSPAVPMDAVRHEHDVEISFDLPGVDPATIDLTVERNVLTMRAERRFQVAEGDEWIARERRHGSFTRQVFLGDTLDTGRVEATYDNGVLRVRIPVAETAKARKIEIAGGGGQARSIETTSEESAKAS